MSVFLKSWQWQIFRSICENGRAYSFIHFSTIDCSNQSGSRPFASQRHSPTPPRKKKRKKSGAGGFLISGDLASGLRWADIFANEWAAGLRRGEQIKKKTCQKLAIGTTAANIKKKEKKKEKKFKQYNKLLQYRKNIAWTLYTVQVQHNDTQPTYLLYLYNFESIHGCWPKATKTMFNFYVKHQCDWCGFKQQTWGAIWFVT